MHISVWHSHPLPLWQQGQVNLGQACTSHSVAVREKPMEVWGDLFMQRAWAPL